MICHHSVNYVICPPSPHVARDATRLTWMLAARDEALQLRLMTLFADRYIVRRCLLVARCTMRIVASGAHKCAAAALRALRLAQPVSGADDFELVIASRASRVIEVHQEVRQRLAWNVRER